MLHAYYVYKFMMKQTKKIVYVWLDKLRYYLKRTKQLVGKMYI